MLGHPGPQKLTSASQDELGWVANWVVGRLIVTPLFWIGRTLKIWPNGALLARTALYVVCRTRLPNDLWTRYTSEGEPDYSPGKADDPTRRERESITATYNALDALKAATGNLPLTLYRSVCKQLENLQDSRSGFWGTTHKSLEGGVETIGGIPRHTAMAVATVCEFGDLHDFSSARLHTAIRWLVRTSSLKSGGWSYTNTTRMRRPLGPLSTAAVLRALFEYKSKVQVGRVKSVGRSRSQVSLEEIDHALEQGLTVLLAAQRDGLWNCQNDASKMANQFRDGLSILRWIGPVASSIPGQREAARNAAIAFAKACKDADYDNSLDPAAHPVAIYLGCADLARTYVIPDDGDLSPAVIQSLRLAFSEGRLSHWDWQRCCIGLYAQIGESRAKIRDSVILLDARKMHLSERCLTSACKAIVRKSILFKQFNPLIRAGILIFIIWEVFIFIMGLISDANDWKLLFKI